MHENNQVTQKYQKKKIPQDDIPYEPGRCSALAEIPPVLDEVRRERRKKSGKELFFLVCLVTGIFFLEFFDTSGGVDQFLFTGEEGMNGGADLHTHLTVDRTQLDFVAAGANRCNFVILWMDIGFHMEHS